MPSKARLLVFSYALRSVAAPILNLFLSAYLWRMTSSVTIVAMYNLGLSIALPLGFLANGKALKRFHVTKTHFFGLFLSMLGTVSVIFFHNSNWTQVLLYGLISGLGGGIYWSSRNYLTFQETHTKARGYFFSLTSISSSLINIMVSFAIGWIIAFADISRLYTPFMAYAIIAGAALIVIFFAGSILFKAGFDSPIIKKVWQPFISKRWNLVRASNVAVGLLEGASSLICTLLILYFLGKEGVLGTIGAAVSLFTILLYYLYGRLARHHHRGPILIISLLVSLALAALLIISASPISILVYVLLAGLPISFYWLTINPWQLDMMDKELSAHPGEKYALIVDNEIFLNIGRITGLLIFLALSLSCSGIYALRISPIILTLLQIALFALVWKKINWDSN